MPPDRTVGWSRSRLTATASFVLGARLPVLRPFAAKVLVVTLFASIACQAPRFTHGSAVGDVGTTRAILWVRTSRSVDLELQLLTDGSRPTTHRSQTTRDSDFASRFELRNLRPGTKYRYEIRIRGKESAPLRGSFATAPSRSQAAPVRFVFGGDIAGQNVCRDVEQGIPILGVMRRRSPDFFVALGDLIYADSPCHATGALGNRQVAGFDRVARSLADFRAVWRYVRADPGYRRLLSSVPLYAIWDDHEVENDFGPGRGAASDRLLAVGRRAFVEYNPMRPARGGDFFRSFRHGRNLELFVLDTRSGRSPNAARDEQGRPKSMLGPQQRRRFVEQVSRSDAVWKFVVSSVPLSIPTGTRATLRGRDGWANHGTLTGFEQELTAILATLAERRVRNLVFLVTDVHFASVIRYRPFPRRPAFTFYEVVTGPLQAGLFPSRELDESLRPERLFFYGPEPTALPRTFAEALPWFNFGEVEISKRGVAHLRVVNGLGAVVFEKRLVPAR